MRGGDDLDPKWGSKLLRGKELAYRARRSTGDK